MTQNLGHCHAGITWHELRGMPHAPVCCGRSPPTQPRRKTEVTRFLSHVWVPRLDESNIYRRTACVAESTPRADSLPGLPALRSCFLTLPACCRPPQSYTAVAFKRLRIKATARCSGVRLPSACLMHAFARMRRHQKGKRGRSQKRLRS